MAHGLIVRRGTKAERLGLPVKRLQDTVRKHKPRGWSIVWSRRGLGKDTLAQAEIETKIIRCGRIKKIYDLYLYLHECGHAWHHKNDNRPKHEEEYEAELYAIYSMMAEGYRVPREFLTAAKDRVREHVNNDRREGKPIRHDVAAWLRVKEPKQ